MIVNMPPVGGSAAGSPPNNNNNNNNNTTNNNTTNGYNFLKRKYVEQELSLGQDFESLESSNPWKKRHLDAYDAGDLQFHLQMDQPAAVKDSVSADPAAPATGSSFINDLFAYDTTLLVPTPAPTAHYSTHCPPSAGGSGAAGGGGGGGPLEDNGGWQAGELLELDHRYNSGLQAELGQLNATLPPPPPHQQQQQQQQNPVPTGSPSFLFPQKQRIVTTGRRTSSGSGSGSNGVQEATEADFEDKNLSWLLNFKFDEFPHLSPHNQAGNGNGQPVVMPEGSAPPPGSSTALGHSPCQSTSPTPASAAGSLAGSTSASAISASATNSNHSLISDQRARSPKNCASTGGVSSGGGGGGVAAGGPAGGSGSNKTGRKFEELVMEVTSELDGNDMIVAEHVVVEDTTSKAPKKPPFTYTELIEYALEDKGELTVSGIYQWISDRFPYYKSNDDRWKNSVRHNLSINPHFRKGVKAPQGAGHLWAISSGDSAENVLAWEHKKQRLDLFFKMESINRERIQHHQQQLQQQQQQQHQQQQQQQQHQQQQQQNCQSPQQQHATQSNSCLYDEAAVAAATLTQEMLQHQTPNNAPGESQPPNHSHGHVHHNHNHSHNHSQSHSHHNHQSHQRLLPFNDLLSDDELRKTAGQILNGIHREVEVQSVNSIISTYHDVLLDNEDYLNPIHKDVVVTESGLRQHHGHNLAGGSGNMSNSQYYITEIDPMELGIQMSHQVEPSEEEVLFSDEFNLNYFGYNPGSDIVA
ncbi:hypothetical protein KR026_006304 [Drosophila bipectinata]|nr:hypothetical protein KR026_006304 [Drosophila bipectinata]